MCCFRSCAFIQSTVVTVVIMQAAELQSGIANCADQTENFLTAFLFDASAIHAGIDVEKNSQAAPIPLENLFLVLGQHGNADLRKLFRDFAHAAGIGAARWIS